MYVYVMNWYRFAVGCWAFYFENNYFGWNRLPGSDAELVCDLIILLIFTSSLNREKV